MISIHFTAADLCKITFVSAPNALAETTTSVHRLCRWRAGLVRPRPGTERWHREMGGGLQARAGLLFDLLPRRPGDWMPCFLWKPATSDLADAVELLSRTPTPELAADIGRLAPFQRARTQVRELADGSAGARQRLARDVRDYFDESLAPLWSRIQAAAVADRALRSEVLERSGIDGLFATLGKGWRWRPPTLRVPAPFTEDVHLGGRGLLLLPSYFGIAPVMAKGPGGSGVLVYPMHVGHQPDHTRDALGALLGHTRAAVLAALRVSSSTTALADRSGISPSSASQHATALRDAGLISTTRRGMAVEHALTPLGAALLHGDARR